MRTQKHWAPKAVASARVLLQCNLPRANWCPFLAISPSNLHKPSLRYTWSVLPLHTSMLSCFQTDFLHLPCFSIVFLWPYNKGRFPHHREGLRDVRVTHVTCPGWCSLLEPSFCSSVGFLGFCSGLEIFNLPILLTDLSHSCVPTFLLHCENHNCMLHLGQWWGDYCKAWNS